MKLKTAIFTSCFVISLYCDNLKSQPGWFQLNSGTAFNLYNVVVLDSNTVIAATDNNYIIRSTNGGMSFDTIYISLPSSGIRRIKFYNENTGCLLTDAIFKTTNKGATWSFVCNRPLIYSIYMDLINEYNIIITGVDPGPGMDVSPVPLYAITTNGGANWSVSGLFDLGSAGFVRMFDENNIYIFVHNRIHKTSNGGSNWSQFMMDVNYDNYYIHSENIIYSSGFNGLIQKTTNAGINWFNQQSGVNQFLNKTFFINENTGWIVGNAGTIVYTSNSGSQWLIQNSTVNNDLSSVHFLDSNIGYAVGRNGVIVKTVTGGIMNIHTISQSIPESFNLYQNFPNPFNPSTKIKFDLIKSSNVNLSIYDVTGKLISTLVKEKLDAGTYEYTWNAERFSSGLYFLRMHAFGNRISAGENFLDTKSMILLK